MLQFYPVLILLSIPAFGVVAIFIVKKYFMKNMVYDDPD